MYKYRYNNQIHSASGFSEAMKQKGLSVPNGIDPNSHFIVRIWQWDEDEDDFCIEMFDPPGHRTFKEYDHAMTCFRAMIAQYPLESMEESKLELVHYHRGKITTYHSKILFPPLLATEP